MTPAIPPRDFAADLAAFLDAHDVQEAVIVGHSIGSSVAQRFAVKYPDRTLGLVSVSSRASMQGRPGLLELWESTISKLTDPVDPDFVRSFVESSFVRPLPETFPEVALQDALKVPAHVWKGAFKTAMEVDLLQDLEAIQAPTLLIWGAEDATVPQGDREAIVDSRRIVYPGVGHEPHAEAPERFAADLVAFVEACVK